VIGSGGGGLSLAAASALPPSVGPARWPVGSTAEGKFVMLWAAVVVLLVLWAIGFFIMNLGDIIHAVFVLVVVLILGNLLRGVGKRRST
jgi:hypothetical protein